MAGGLAVAKLTSGSSEPLRAAEACALSGYVVAEDPVGRSSRMYPGVRVGAIVLPAAYDQEERFVELGVTGDDGTFVVGCAGVESPSAIALAHASWKGCVHVTDVVIPRDGAEHLRLAVWDFRMTNLSNVGKDGDCVRPAHMLGLAAAHPPPPTRYYPDTAKGSTSEAAASSSRRAGSR